MAQTGGTDGHRRTSRAGLYDLSQAAPEKQHSTNPIARLNEEVERRVDVVGIVPNEASIARPFGAGPFEQNDEWQTASRYIQVEAFAGNRSRGNKPNSQHRSRPTVTSGHPVNYTTLTDVARAFCSAFINQIAGPSRQRRADD